MRRFAHSTFLCLLFAWAAAAQSTPPPLLDESAREAMLAEASRFLGVRYIFGAAPTRNDAADCSSLVLKAFQKVGVPLPRTAHQQSKLGAPISLDQLRRGDRLYFKMTSRPVPIDHTAIYLGDGKMLHAFPGIGVAIESLDGYRSVLVSARR